MTESDWLAQRFQEHRSRLRAVAYRMLGSLAEADDAVQEAWLRASRSDTPHASPASISQTSSTAHYESVLSYESGLESSQNVRAE
jgi:Sigma-70 region 2